MSVASSNTRQSPIDIKVSASDLLNSYVVKSLLTVIYDFINSGKL